MNTEQIELVVKMPRYAFEKIVEKDSVLSVLFTHVECMHDAIKNGTVLPKGHGRLIDADKLKLTQHDIHIESIGYRHRCVSAENIDEAQTIVEADKEVM